MTSMGKVALEVRELYLSKFVKMSPYICNAMSPRVLLLRLNPMMIDKYTTESTGKNDQFMSDEEEDWFSAVPDDWEDDSKEWNMSLLEPIVQISDESNSRRGTKRKRGGGRGYGKKRGRLAVDVDRASPVEDVPVKQEKPDSPEHMVEIPPDVSMNILPNVGAYTAPIPVYPLAPAVLPLYMAQSQMSSMLPTANYSSGNPDDVLSNSDRNSVATVQNAGDETGYAHTNVEANIKQEIPDSDNPDQVIAMPFQSELQNDGSCLMPREVVTASPLPAIEDFSDTRSRNRNKSQEQASARASGSFKDQSLNMGQKSLRELTNLLVKLNNKNLQCDEKIQILKEEYDRKVAVIEAEKKANEKELDSVLSLIQNWKEGSKGETSKRSRKTTEK
ncbi:uncharacterized protein [Procambarus clarkii]|uniref:uncharacterized protein isoform X2 n=1 Tax=Procambarus clarkii TaxID=6728 RepID=UPI001E673405|nr:uncharacterized protein LOC123744848 isoform X2 [Procambarus clarkii]